MKRSVMCRIRVSTTFKSHSCQCDRQNLFLVLHGTIGTTRVVMGGGDVNGLQKHMYIIL